MGNEMNTARWRYLTVPVVAVLALIVALALVPAGPAVADDGSEFPSCQYYDETVGPAGNPGGGTHTPDEGDWYAYSRILTVPSWSACEDININNQYGDFWRWRIRFYPSSGGNYANAWKASGCQLCYFEVATAVSNGTRFRFEGHKAPASGGQIVYSRSMRVSF